MGSFLEQGVVGKGVLSEIVKTIIHILWIAKVHYHVHKSPVPPPFP